MDTVDGVTLEALRARLYAAGDLSKPVGVTEADDPTLPKCSIKAFVFDGDKVYAIPRRNFILHQAILADRLAVCPVPVRVWNPQRASRGHVVRRTVRSCARAPDDARPRRLTGEERRAAKLLVDAARRARLAASGASEDWRTCARCLREQEPGEFGRPGSYCKSCERERALAAYYRRKSEAVAA